MVRSLFAAAGFGLAALGATAAAACPTNCSTCCNLPTTHQVVIPGVTVTPPNITIGSPTLGCDTCGGGGGGGGFGSINVTVNIEQSATAVANTSASASGLSNAAAANLITSGGGGGGGFFDSGPSTSIGNVTVVENTPPAPPPPPEMRKVCVAQKWIFAAVAIQAVCLDDKGSPHPASQTGPDRDVAQGFSGELFRCVAGSHMQYISVDYQGGPPSFDRGQTKVCAKGDALWRTAEGQVQCRPQTAARDCNERSLLRRYGPGIKVVKAGAQVCAAWSTQVIAAAGPAPAMTPGPIYAGQSFAGDGGVGRGW